MAKWNEYIGGEADEFGNGPGSYDIDKSVWHVNCCGSTDTIQNGWSIFNAILGWQNSATYGSVISYNLYWISIMTGFIIMRFKEAHGRWPFGKPKAPATPVDDTESHASSNTPKNLPTEKTTTAVSA
ncbi:high-affinity iron permease [Fusarium torreyae]|uniref:High-affinity iron permease n=1 Tax=Fusarium torreyae TaxID=1237075 RepID=A0A9W8VBC3_9HYPO|nr:high-affinity iron permease [Fusarium torreyae]